MRKGRKGKADRDATKLICLEDFIWTLIFIFPKATFGGDTKVN